MNASAETVKPKRSHHKKKPAVAVTAVLETKPKLPPLDPLAAAQEACQLAQEGNIKLARAIDILREGLQLLVFAEADHSTKPPTPMTASMLRTLAAETLDAYGRLTGQNWRSPRNQVVHTRAGKADHDFAKNRGNDGGDYD
jgi:hypothetical protein